MNAFKSRLAKALPSGKDDPGRRYFKLTVYLSLSIILVMVLASVIAFLITLEGEEQTLVPDVQGMDLANAMIELQQKGLIGKIQLRVSQNLSDKGSILNQDPSSGTLVKVGREVNLRVSTGPIIDAVDNYVNKAFSEVELQLQSLSSIYGAVLKIKKPVMEIYSEAPAGTILEQKPKPGTRIAELTELELVVSKGPQGSLITVGDYIGLPFYEALALYATTNSPFVFNSRSANADEGPGKVVSQSPAAGTDVEPGTLIQFIISTPREIPENYAFGILQRTLPDYPVLIDLIVEVISPAGETRELAKMKHPGGLISIPYLEEIDTQIIVSSSLRELFRYTIREPTQS